MKFARSTVRTICYVLSAVALSIFSSPTAHGSDTGKGYDQNYSAARPIECMRIIDINNFVWGISNFGRIGAGYKPLTDCITGARVPWMEFPRDSRTTYLYKGALWIGAIVENDTLVSTGADFNIPSTEFLSDLPIIKRSTLGSIALETQGAVSELDYIANYTDTVIPGANYPRFGHKPLEIAVTQSSYAWSYRYAEDFTLMDLNIRNIGQFDLHDVYVGIYMDADVHEGTGQDPNQLVPTTPGVKPVTEGSDDLCGFLYDFPSMHGSCEFRDTVGLAWTIDNEGEYDRHTGFGVPNVVGVRLLGDAFDIDYMSYNWWVAGSSPSFDYGPQKWTSQRQMFFGLGQPYRDADKYHLLSNREIDYSSPYTAAITDGNQTWISASSPSYARTLATGADIQYLLSVGPYDLAPGADISVPFAFVAGENAHYDERNYGLELANGYNPDEFIAGLDFSDFVGNAVTAAHIYDNPGVDTDGDGYVGKLHECILDSAVIDSILPDTSWVYTVVESTYYEGDGVPDYRSAGPPPPPKFWVNSAVNGVRVRFNGFDSETTRDVFSGLIDFEGYRVYMARDEREESYSVMASYDRENYDKYIFRADLVPPRFVVQDLPFDIEELRCLYGLTLNPCDDSLFNPLNYTRSRPLRLPNYPDSVIYFEKHDYNASHLGSDTPIRKLYPQVPAPDLSKPIPPDQLTEDGYLKYYEYEVLINNLVSTVPYFVSVTAFDFGSPETGLEPLETSKQLNATEVYAAGSAAEATGTMPDAYVYPNPFRIDANYRANGFEGRGRDDLPEYRTYRINFANIPPQCWIRIFSLDGDLIKEFRHDEPSDSPTARHATWDMVTRNRQLIVSGLYYWSIESDDGRTQIGKLVVLF